MKKYLVILALLASTPVFAEKSISLQAGSSADIEGTLVKCLGAPNPDLPRCKVNSHGANIYGIIVGNSEWGTVAGFDQAVKIVIQLKEANLCS